PGENRAIKFGAFDLPTRISLLVALLDEQPALPIARTTRAISRLDYRESSTQLLAVEHHVDFAPSKLLLRHPPVFRLVFALVPDHHRSGAVLTLRNHPLEIGIFKRMVFRPDGQPLLGRIHGRSFGHRPRNQNTVDREAKVIVQAAGIMLLHDKDPRAARAPHAPRWF